MPWRSYHAAVGAGASLPNFELRRDKITSIVDRKLQQYLNPLHILAAASGIPFDSHAAPLVH